MAELERLLENRWRKSLPYHLIQEASLFYSPSSASKASRWVPSST